MPFYPQMKIIVVNKDFCFAGEVGLSGEIRPVKPCGSTHSEVENRFFIFVSKYNKIALKMELKSIGCQN
jgi:DNA repair protein RadA/Sms